MIERLRVQNYRVLKDVELAPLTSLTVLVGPNGSGKSTVLDVIRFLREAVAGDLAGAWTRRGGLAELRSREADGPLRIEFDYREREDDDLMSYNIELDEEDGALVVTHERLLRTEVEDSKSITAVLAVERGRGVAASTADKNSRRIELTRTDVLALSVLGQVGEFKHLAVLHKLVSGWEGVDPLPSAIRSGVGDRAVGGLSLSGDNLAVVVERLRRDRLPLFEHVISRLRAYVPNLETVRIRRLSDGRPVVELKDSAFGTTVGPAGTSDGTLRLLAFLVVLHSADPAPLIALEEPENYLHPRLMYSLAEEVREASGHSQLLVTTHSPHFVDAVRPREVWVLARGDDGYASSTRVGDLPDVVSLVDHGEALGELWTQGAFGVGDPLEGSP